MDHPFESTTVEKAVAIRKNTACRVRNNRCAASDCPPPSSAGRNFEIGYANNGQRHLTMDSPRILSWITFLEMVPGRFLLSRNVVQLRNLGLSIVKCRCPLFACPILKMSNVHLHEARSGKRQIATAVVSKTVKHGLSILRNSPQKPLLRKEGRRVPLNSLPPDYSDKSLAGPYIIDKLVD
jgi:hypothetical protein